MFLTVTADLFGGFLTSVLLFCLTLLFSIPLGLVLMAGLRSRIQPVSWITNVVIWIIRGTPLMLQLLVIFFAPGLLFGSTVFASQRFLAALVTFVINYAGYFAVIYKGGYESIPKIQTESAMALGLESHDTFVSVLLPQMVKRIIAPMSNEIITLVKDTSLVRVIAVVEIIKVAERYTSQGLIWPLFYTGVFYLLFTALVTWFFHMVEEKTAYIEMA